MYSLNKNKNSGAKLVRIQSKQNKTKKKGYDIKDQDIDYLKQVIRNKNQEVKKGGGKMEKLLSSNSEIEALLARGNKRSKKQTHQEKKEIHKLLETNSNLKTEVQEVDLTSNISQNVKQKNNSKPPESKKTVSKKRENNSNFLEKLIDTKTKKSKNSSNINLDLSGVKFKKSKKNQNKPKNTNKKTRKKEFPQELSKLSKKNHNFISQLLKPNLKIQKAIQKKDLKNLKKDSSTIKLSKRKLTKNKNYASKSTSVSKINKRSKKKIISAVIKAPKISKSKRSKSKNSKQDSLNKKTHDTKPPISAHATTKIHTKEIGIQNFQPTNISWS